MFITLVLLAALSLVLSVIFTPMVRQLALHYNLVDLPDNKRKVHKLPVPRVGGIALAAAYFGSLIITALFVTYSQGLSNTGFGTVKSIALPALLIFLIGLADDIFNLKPMHKFGMQIIAAGVAVLSGVHIYGIGILSVHPRLEAMGTIIWLVACTNAVNLIDGLDGLAAGIAFLATVTTLIASIMSGNLGLTIATLPLAGALLGFLVFNFNPASIFLGDSGSLLLGFLLGCYSIMWNGSSPVALAAAAPLLALAVPLLDTTLAIARRFLSKQPIFGADRSHIHHRLLARGLSHRGTVLLLYVAAAMAGFLSLCLLWAHDIWQVAVIGVFVCAVMLGIRQLRYAEFGAFGRIILRRGIRNEISAKMAAQGLEESLRAARTADECWSIIQTRCADLGLFSTRGQLDGHFFFADHEPSPLGTWVMSIPISNTEWIELCHNSGELEYPGVLVLFANSLKLALTDKQFGDAAVKDKTAAFSTGMYKAAASVAN